MDVRILNKICFTICIVCIVLGTLLGLAMIWGNIRDNEFVWKSWLTICLLFLASALTLSVSRTFEGWNARRWSEKEPEREPTADRQGDDRFRAT